METSYCDSGVEVNFFLMEIADKNGGGENKHPVVEITGDLMVVARWRIIIVMATSCCCVVEQSVDNIIIIIVVVVILWIDLVVVVDS